MAEIPKPKDQQADFDIDEAISDELSGAEPGPDLAGTAKPSVAENPPMEDQIEALSGYEALLDVSSETQMIMTLDDHASVDSGLSRQAAQLQPLPVDVRAALLFADERIKITKSLTIIGRLKEAADIAFPDDDQLSRHHAAVVYSNGEFWIEDLDSTNGTFLRGGRVKRAALEPGVEVRVGSRVFRLLLG